MFAALFGPFFFTPRCPLATPPGVNCEIRPQQTMQPFAHIA